MKSESREGERDLIFWVVIFGKIGVGQSLSCCWSLVRVHVQDQTQQVNGRGVGPDKEGEEVFAGVEGEGSHVAASRLVVDLVHQGLVGCSADLDDPSEVLAILAELGSTAVSNIASGSETVQNARPRPKSVIKCA